MFQWRYSSSFPFFCYHLFISSIILSSFSPFRFLCLNLFSIIPIFLSSIRLSIILSLLFVPLLIFFCFVQLRINSVLFIFPPMALFVLLKFSFSFVSLISFLFYASYNVSFFRFPRNLFYFYFSLSFACSSVTFLLQGSLHNGACSYSTMCLYSVSCKSFHMPVFALQAFPRPH
jgi:hypothetical protein